MQDMHVFVSLHSKYFDFSKKKKVFPIFRSQSAFYD